MQFDGACGVSPRAIDEGGPRRSDPTGIFCFLRPSMTLDI